MPYSFIKEIFIQLTPNQWLFNATVVMNAVQRCTCHWLHYVTWFTECITWNHWELENYWLSCLCHIWQCQKLWLMVWPFGKLPFECQKMPHFGPFFDIQMVIFRRSAHGDVTVKHCFNNRCTSLFYFQTKIVTVSFSLIFQSLACQSVYKN